MVEVLVAQPLHMAVAPHPHPEHVHSRRFVSGLYPTIVDTEPGAHKLLVG